MTEESLFGTTESPPVIARHDRGAAGKHSAALPILKPLAERMRPQTLDEVIGQKKLWDPEHRCGWRLRIVVRTP